LFLAIDFAYLLWCEAVISMTPKIKGDATKQETQFMRVGYFLPW